MPSAGASSATSCAVSSPAFQNRCGVPGGTVIRAPEPTTARRAADADADAARDHLDPLDLPGMEVLGGGEPVRRQQQLDDDRTATGLGCRLAKDDDGAGTCVLEPVPGAEGHVAIVERAA